MILKKIMIVSIVVGVLGCNPTKKEGNSGTQDAASDVKIVGAMKNVMWRGELSANINLDTIADKAGLYGLGPESNLTGELLINDGKAYVSKVNSDSTMKVEERYDVSAPFFVYANVTEWNEIELPLKLKTIADLEKFIVSSTTDFKHPLAFKLIGEISKATIHIQNLPPNTKVSSPEEAHAGQINFELSNEKVDIIGFFSTEHQGIFTHHDSFLHMHLMTEDETQMGHLDELEIQEMKLYLPKQ